MAISAGHKKPVFIVMILFWFYFSGKKKTYLVTSFLMQYLLERTKINTLTQNIENIETSSFLGQISCGHLDLIGD